MKIALLGGISAAQFLRQYWHKQPLLIRAAVPEFSDIVERAEIESLACQDLVHSRLVTRRRGTWQVRHGPFQPRALQRLPESNWTLLVEGLNHVSPKAAALLARFNFIPHARLDDVMASLAVKGGGVGPHFDSYDVFLLQGAGTRRWQISAQKDQTFDPDAPLRILQRFQADQEWTLESGDMLYLPPHCAHNGIALTECLTYSIGFRAPSYQELISEFLTYLQDCIVHPGLYADPDLRVQKHPAAISDPMLRKVSSIVSRIRWSNRDVERFLGQYLTEPKPQVFFSPPARPVSRPLFNRRALRAGLRMDLKSQMLFRANRIFLNGETYCVAHSAIGPLIELADSRKLRQGNVLAREVEDLLYQWYRAGYIHLGLR